MKVHMIEILMRQQIHYTCISYTQTSKSSLKALKNPFWHGGSGIKKRRTHLVCFRFLTDIRMRTS